LNFKLVFSILKLTLLGTFSAPYNFITKCIFVAKLELFYVEII